MPRNLQSYPKRGEIFVANLNPGFGREVRKKRPVLVISNNTLNQELPTVIIIPFSSIVPKFAGPDVVKIKNPGVGLNKESVLIANQIRSIDKSRLIKRVGKLSQNLFEETKQALKITLDL
ncbi:type II toxin-antitoxin system PemK/MazF family toxin [Candidatus Curtissbacteria bacterium]|nr:type II toxin-antitoxin system PemK/MazF family toxin [Candidatus Curtissbacteria bacterium]